MVSFLVVDANVLFAGLIKRGKTAELLVSPRLKLFAPEFLLEELEDNVGLFSRKTRLTIVEFDAFLGVLMRRIEFVSGEEFLEEAKEISPPDDFPYVASALYLKSMGYEVRIWSNDKELKDKLEGRIIVIPTLGLLKELGIIAP